MRLVTNYGNLNVELHCDLVPKTCENFMKLSQKNYYNGTKFHRSIRHFMASQAFYFQKFVLKYNIIELSFRYKVAIQRELAMEANLPGVLCLLVMSSNQTCHILEEGF